MDEVEASAAKWREQVRARGSIERNREALARLIEYDHDPFETELYESSSDPRNRLVDKAERSYAGQYDRRLRRLREHARRVEGDEWPLREIRGIIFGDRGTGRRRL